MPLVLNEVEVRKLLPIADLIPLMERTLVQCSTGQVVQPLRTVLNVGAEQAYCFVMPAFVSDPEALGTKLVTIYARNPSRDLPSHLATIVLLDPATGALAAILDGRYITAARTAAVSTVAARHLAHLDGPVPLAIIGSGVQAQSHLTAFTEALSISEVRIWSPTAVHRQRLAKEAAALVRPAVRAVDAAEDAIRGSTLIVLATSAAQPGIQNAWVSNGAHVTSVGAPVPHQREMDPALVARARVIVDSRDGALTEAGDIVLGISEDHFGVDHVVGEIGEVIDGRVTGRTSASDVTIFKSVGMAVEDVAAAQLAFSRAQAQGRGQQVAW